MQFGRNDAEILNQRRQNMEQLNVLSHGAGVQTSAMVYMVLAGVIPKPDLIVFADPQWELEATYEYLAELIKAVQLAGIPMIVETAGNIYEDTMNSALTGERAASMPFYTQDVKDEGFVSRQCTNDYKIEVVKQAARKFLGLEHRQWLKTRIIMWQGITTDEIERIKTSKEKMIDYHYPLFELGMDRLDCMNWLVRNGHTIPPKSSCIGCPFHSRQTWVDLKRDHPEEFKQAVTLDRAIRNHKKFKSQVFLHKDRIDLEEAVTRDSLQGDLFDIDSFANGCNVHCGV